MEKDLMKFNENIQLLKSKDVCRYEDEKGNAYILPISQTIINCEYLELNEAQFKIAKFEGKVESEEEYNKITVKKVKDKYQETKKKEDMGTLVEYEEEVSQVWILKNGLGITKAYKDKEEALQDMDNWNDDILKQAEIIK